MGMLAFEAGPQSGSCFGGMPGLAEASFQMCGGVGASLKGPAVLGMLNRAGSQGNARAGCLVLASLIDNDRNGTLQHPAS